MRVQEKEQTWKQILKLFRQSKLDGIFLLGARIHMELLTDLQRMQFYQQGIFNIIPIFLPIEYSNANYLDLKLNSNFVFYQYQGDGTYNLVDKFAVNVQKRFRAPPISLELGTWKNGSGLQLVESLDRPTRRTDLKGAPYLVADHLPSNQFDIPKYLLQGYLLEGMNMTLRTVPIHWRGCIYQLGWREVDACNNRATSFSLHGSMTVLPLQKMTYTLLIRNPTENVVKVTVHVDVFGLGQWMVIFCSLIVISLLTHLFQVVLVGFSERHTVPWSEGLALPFLFLLQLGEHPEDRHMAKSTLSLTLSLVTMMVFIYYANDITSEMTAGSPPPVIRTWQDAIDQGFKVHILGGMSPAMGIMMKAKKNSTKHRYFMDNFSEDTKKIKRYEVLKKFRQFKKAAEIDVPKWHDGMKQDDMVELLMKDKKALWHCTLECHPFAVRQGKILLLDMDDMHDIFGGILLTAASEHLTILQRRWIQGHESGVFNRLTAKFNNLRFSAMPPVKIGISEAAVLSMENVAPLFYFLILFGIISTAISLVEKLVQIFKSLKSRRSEVSLHSNT